MFYYIKRYLNGIRKVKKWLPLIVAPCLAYLAVAGLSADRFSVSQLVSVDVNSPVALSRTPVDVVPMSEILAGREGLFLDDFAVLDLSRRLQKETALKQATIIGRDLRKLIEDSMSMQSADNSHVEIGYFGSDIQMGRILVDFFTKKLVMRNQEGIARSIRYNKTASLGKQSANFIVMQASAGVSGPAGESLDIKPASPVGEMRIREYRALWRPERLSPALALLALSVVLMGIAAGVVEWSDPSFKSVRQTARYLNTPVLGTIPNIGDALHFSTFDESG
ncbi:MAG: hypothetical protein C4582_04205 [Desulfobacteraceae bacterium]|jgi:hypothetical protein|nr:MAG: hypothetical protein C4582_04205 [Desulfobacteraceae bacterium]